MKRVDPGADPDAFFADLSRAPARVLMLDFDGTLAPFRERRDRAVPHPGVRERLEAILEGGRTRLVVISGRSLADLRPLLGIEPPPELWGTHGWERLRPGAEPSRRDPGGEARRALDEGRSRALERVPADRVETKPASVAVHTRGLSPDEAGATEGAVTDAWSALAKGAPVEIHAFDGGIELRVSGWDKGSAVREILAEEPPGAAAAYLGDDRTDEDAFRALEDRGLAVLVREARRPTAAHIWIRPPDGLLAFFDRWLKKEGE